MTRTLDCIHDYDFHAELYYDGSGHGHGCVTKDSISESTTWGSHWHIGIASQPSRRQSRSPDEVHGALFWQ